MQVKKYAQTDFSQGLLIEPVFDLEQAKQVRITLPKGVKLDDHKSPKQISVQVLKGKVKFGVEGEVLELDTLDMIFLEGGVMHSLEGLEDSIVGLTIYK